jgi:hypothetical protein
LSDVAVGTDDDGFDCGGHAEGGEGRFVCGHDGVGNGSWTGMWRWGGGCCGFELVIFHT